jgi:hypothetical protein
MKTELESYDAPEQEAGELDAGSPEQHSDDDADAYRQFLSDRRTIRYEDTPANRRKLFDYLKYRPALPESPAALFLAYEQLCEADELELTPLAPEKSPDMRTAGEVQAEEAEQAEPTQIDVAKDATTMSKMFRTRQRGTLTRFKNGAQIS